VGRGFKARKNFKNRGGQLVARSYGGGGGQMRSRGTAGAARCKSEGGKRGLLTGRQTKKKLVE